MNLISINSQHMLDVMKAYRCTKQMRRRRPDRTGARAPSPEYRIGDRHKRGQRAKLDIMLDHWAGYSKRGPRIEHEFHPLKVPIWETRASRWPS